MNTALVQFARILGWRYLYPPPFVLQSVEFKQFMEVLVEVAGVEPCNSKTQDVDNQTGYVANMGLDPQMAPQKSGVDDPELARIVAAWSDLNEAQRRAIEAIVDIV